MSISIEPMRREHWPVVAAIYQEGIATGDATFETSVPEWQAWDAAHLAAGRLVAVLDGAVAGWAALSPISRRRAYAGVAEVSVYVAASHRGEGIGSRLLAALIDAAEGAQLWTLQASVFPENEATLRLHARHGFREVGRRERIGKLDGRWRDTLLLERRSGGGLGGIAVREASLVGSAAARTRLNPERTTIMDHPVSLPFTIRRGQDVIDSASVTTTKETVHGLLRLEADELTIQWRRYLRTERVGMSIRTDKEIEAVRSVTVPIGSISSANVRPGRWWWSKSTLMLTAADLRAFEGIAGETGLQLEHPAELTLPFSRKDRLRAQEFAAELTLAIVEAGGAPRIEEPVVRRIGGHGSGERPSRG